MESTEYAASDGQRPPRRKRIVPSCSECRRRKQKCDRKLPCNHCILRNVPRKCTFDGGLKSRQSNDSSILTQDQSVNGLMDLAEQDQDASNTTDIALGAGDLGYSAVADSNNLTHLNQILPEEDGIPPPQMRKRQPSQALNPSSKAHKLVAMLPQKDIIDALLEVFFTHVNWQYDIVEKVYFEDVLAHWYAGRVSSVQYLKRKEFAQELRFFPTLLFQILAHSLQFLPPNATVVRDALGDDPNLSETYSNLGEELMQLLGRRGLALTAVQADLLRASLLKNIGRGTEAWFSLGNSIRQAQELGLHRQTEIVQSPGDRIGDTLSLIWYDEYRRRVWISLFAWDSLMAMILGRPRAINLDDCDAKIPTDSNTPKDPSQTLLIPAASHKNNTASSSVSALLVRYELAKKVHEMRNLKLDRPNPKNPSAIQTLHDEAIFILDDAPPLLRSTNPDTSWDSQYPSLPQQREELLILVQLLLITLHRPHIASRRESRLAAFHAAATILESQQRWFDQSGVHQYKLFSLSFYTIDAAILLSVIAILHPSQDMDAHQNLDTLLEQAISRLSTMKPYNRMADAGLGILQKCYQKLQNMRKSSKTGGSAMDLLDLQKELNSPSSGTLGGSESGTSSSPGQLNAEFYTWDLPDMSSDFYGTYWLDQINQIQLPPWTESITGNVWESALFD